MSNSADEPGPDDVTADDPAPRGTSNPVPLGDRVESAGETAAPPGVEGDDPDA